jgi:hypothetical protein
MTINHLSKLSRQKANSILSISFRAEYCIYSQFKDETRKIFASQCNDGSLVCALRLLLTRPARQFFKYQFDYCRL